MTEQEKIELGKVAVEALRLGKADEGQQKFCFAILHQQNKQNKLLRTAIEKISKKMPEATGK